MCIIFLAFYSCKDTVQRPMKYDLNGEILSCTATYEKEELIKVVCFNENRDTILEELYINSLRNGLFSRKYDNGNIKEQGNHCNDFPCGEWKVFYENGILQKYEFYKKVDETKDSTILYYYKHFDESGVIDSSILPLAYQLEPKDSVLRIGSTYSLYIELLHSEYDSLHSYLIQNELSALNISSDTLAFYGPKALITFKPKIRGEFDIRGIFFERNAFSLSPDILDAEKPFKFKVRVE